MVGDSVSDIRVSGLGVNREDSHIWQESASIRSWHHAAEIELIGITALVKRGKHRLTGANAI